jgi:fructoselysine-6-P-deglycase FrlB-like protein
MEFARYRVRYLPANSAVVAISFSGKVGRTIEAAVQAKRFGHRVIALTGNKDAPWHNRPMTLLSPFLLGYSPGTTTYLALMTALLDLRLSGNARGLDVTGIREHLHSLPELARDTVEQAEMPARELAHRLAGRPWITFLGAGPSLATARFGAAKLFEDRNAGRGHQP